MAEPLRPYETARRYEARDDSGNAELRQDVPRWMLQVFDAMAIARGVPRTVVLNEIMGKAASEYLHMATVIGRVMGVNPTDSDRTGR